MKSVFTKAQALRDLHSLKLWFEDTADEIREANSLEPIGQDETIEDTIEFFDWAGDKLKGAIKILTPS